MASERAQKAGRLLNLTPLIDIVFLLLVFFMLTAHFVDQESIAVELPDATSADPTEENPFVEVALTPDGDLLVDGIPTRNDELTRALKVALSLPGKESVRFRGDQDARFGLAVEIIDAARNAGAQSLDILTERP